jgi:UDP-GlcNAc:undecaprenyl-phosphate GlcNAc-1-phosphate transferase
MTTTAFLSHLLFAAVLFFISILITRFMILRLYVIDVPTERSSHNLPTPKSGGIAIVTAFSVGVLAIFMIAEKAMIMKPYFFGFVFSSLLIAGISFYDDLKSRPFTFKLTAQFLAVAVVLASGLIIDEIVLPFSGIVVLGWLSYPVTLLWILGLTNAFNFMDGLDGLAAGAAVIASAFLCIITYNQGSLFVYITCYALFAGILGFLVYNFPPARIFMGDVGSAFIGFCFAVLAVIAARYDHSHTSYFVIPLLLFNFIYDTSFTLVRRFLKGERLVEAHKSHLYQLFNRIGYSQRFVSLFHYCVCIVQGLAAFWMAGLPGSKRLYAFLPFLVFQIVYSWIIMRSAKKAGLL